MPLFSSQCWNINIRPESHLVSTVNIDDVYNIFKSLMASSRPNIITRSQRDQDTRDLGVKLKSTIKKQVKKSLI